MRHIERLAGGAAAAVILAAALSCGGSSTASTPPTTTGPTTPTATNTITITNNTLSPQSMTVTRGSQVTIINNDSRVHQMDSDPHPEHTDCPELNQIGFLNPGQSRQSGNLNTARKCGFHDHDQPDAAALRGTITIQ